MAPDDLVDCDRQDIRLCFIFIFSCFQVAIYFSCLVECCDAVLL